MRGRRVSGLWHRAVFVRWVVDARRSVLTWVKRRLHQRNPVILPPPSKSAHLALSSPRPPSDLSDPARSTGRECLSGWKHTFSMCSSVVLPALSRPRKRSFACLFNRPRDARTSQTMRPVTQLVSYCPFLEVKRGCWPMRAEDTQGSLHQSMIHMAVGCLSGFECGVKDVRENRFQMQQSSFY